ncbi:MAG: phosphotransferase [Acidimicrobiales bacterium]
MARKPKRFMPQSASELTADWFTGALDVSTEAAVRSVEVEMIGSGIGFIGDVFRCKLSWDTVDADLPASVVVKVPSSLRSNRLFGEGVRAYERELDVYRSLSGQLGVTMPVHLHSDMDPNPAPWLNEVIRWLLDNLPLRGVNWLVDRLLSLPDQVLRRFLLVIEDIHDARPANQLESGTVEDALGALECLAGLHAQNWMNSRLVAEHPLVWPANRTPRVFQASYKRHRDDFFARFADVVDPGAAAHLDTIQDRVPELSDHMVTPPWTLLHGDYRLDNVLFRETGDIVIIDYQLVLWGRAGYDVAYFITTALDPEHKGAEDELLDAYLSALVDHGISDYSSSELRRDVKITKELLAHRFVGTGTLLDTEIEGSDHTLIDVMAHRTIGWALD